MSLISDGLQPSCTASVNWWDSSRMPAVKASLWRFVAQLYSFCEFMGFQQNASVKGYADGLQPQLYNFYELMGF